MKALPPIAFLGGGIAALLVGAAVAALAGVSPSGTALRALDETPGDRPWSDSLLPAVGTGEVAWPDPVAQPAGPEWIFDVFTPPIVYFDPERNAFTVEPPVPAAFKPEPVFGLALKSVERQPYRIQVEGYLEGPAGTVFLLKDLATGAGLRLRQGQRSAEAEVTVTAGSVRRRTMQPDDPGATPVVVEEVLVTLADGRTGAAVELRGGEIRYDAEVEAVVVDASGAESRVRQGAVVETALGRFTVVSVDLASRTVTVEKSTAGSDPETRTLSPSAPTP